MEPAQSIPPPPSSGEDEYPVEDTIVNAAPRASSSRKRRGPCRDDLRADRVNRSPEDAPLDGAHPGRR